MRNSHAAVRAVPPLGLTANQATQSTFTTPTQDFRTPHAGLSLHTNPSATCPAEAPTLPNRLPCTPHFDIHHTMSSKPGHTAELTHDRANTRQIRLDQRATKSYQKLLYTHAAHHYPGLPNQWGAEFSHTPGTLHLAKTPRITYLKTPRIPKGTTHHPQKS